MHEKIARLAREILAEKMKDSAGERVEFSFTDPDSGERVYLNIEPDTPGRRRLCRSIAEDLEQELSALGKLLEESDEFYCAGTSPLTSKE